MRTQSWLLIAAVSVVAFAMPLRATTVLSAPTAVSASILVPTNVLTDFEPEVPVWSMTSVSEQNAFTNTVLNDSRVPGHTFEGGPFFESLAVVQPDQARKEARVPEPATLVLLGTGLIGLAMVSQSKWRRRSVGRNSIRAYTS